MDINATCQSKLEQAILPILSWHRDVESHNNCIEENFSVSPYREHDIIVNTVIILRFTAYIVWTSHFKLVKTYIKGINNQEKQWS